MKLWIARDENGSLKLFDKKPLKVLPSYDRSGYVWTVPRGYVNHITLDKRLNPEVTFENSPMEVELTLKQTDSSREE